MESVNKGREERRRREGRKGVSIFACFTHMVLKTRGLTW